MSQLKGITWDHPRGINPLKATLEEYKKTNPEFDISWDVRSLSEFEDFPVEVLAEKYDIMLIDHPFIGQGVKNGILVPIDNWLSKEYLLDQSKNSVGPSYSTYTWDNHQWALPVDVAAQVSAYRRDIFNKFQLKVPVRWEEVFELPNNLSRNFKIGLPLNPVHSYCSFLTIGANLSNDHFFDGEKGINKKYGEQVLDVLHKLVEIVHPSSLEMNPIQMLDVMANNNEIIYSPLIYGYVSYSLESFSKHKITFSNIPSYKTKPIGSVIGGVGMAISARSKNIKAAIDYASYVASEKSQRTIYFDSGGQPGYRGAWLDEKINKNSDNFFENTINTLDNSYTRPRFNGYVEFQDKAGEIIHHALTKKRPNNKILQELNYLLVNIKKKHQ